jgi:hypothetical protein
LLRQKFRVTPASVTSQSSTHSHTDTTPTPHRRLQLLTNSQLRTHHSCALEHHYHYQLGMRPVGATAEALRWGTLWHAGLEAWWRAYATPELQLTAALDTIRPLALDAYDLARAEVLLRGYDTRWRGDLDLEILGVELEFRAPLVNPETGRQSQTFEVGGKFDALVLNHRDSRVYTVEHKSSGQDITPGSTYWQCLRLDSQVSTYHAGAKALGFDVAGCLYDVVGKPRLSPLQATPADKRKFTKAGVLYANQRGEDETPDEFALRLTEHVVANMNDVYQRGWVVRLADEEIDAARDAWLTARRIRDEQLAGYFPRNVSSCERYGRMCEYFPVCTRETSLADWTRYQRVDNTHPELPSAAKDGSGAPLYAHDGKAA